MDFKKVRLSLLLMVLIPSFAAWAQTAVDEHWSPYDYPREIPEGTKYHIVVDGDTLWSLAARYMGDPLLWPQIYNANSYIGDPDFIYPGDPLIMDIGVIVSETAIADDLETRMIEGSPEAGEFSEMDEFAQNSEQDPNGITVQDRSEITDFDFGSSEFVIIPAGDRSDMECSTYLYPMESGGEVLPFDFLVSGGENREKVTFGFNEVVYLNKGRNSGVQPGTFYSVRRALNKVHFPGSRPKKLLGMAIDQVGKIKILAVQESNATAIVSESCFEVRAGDFLIPYEQEPIPLITELPKVNRWEAFNKQGSGRIIFSEDGLLSFGKGHLTNIDLGINHNVAPGDLFIIFRDNPANDLRHGVRLADIYLGHGVALKAGTKSAVMKIIEGYMEMNVGDQVVPLTDNSFVTAN